MFNEVRHKISRYPQVEVGYEETLMSWPAFGLIVGTELSVLGQTKSGEVQINKGCDIYIYMRRPW